MHIERINMKKQTANFKNDWLKTSTAEIYSIDGAEAKHFLKIQFFPRYFKKILAV